MATQEDCKKCYFGEKLHSSGGQADVCCGYLNKTGKRRPYKGAECRLYKVKIKNKEK